MSVVLLEPGMHTTVQDAGRVGRRGLGVPSGGAMDRRSLALGNALVGNAPDEPALEITLTGPALRADHDTALSVFGAPFELSLGGRPVSSGRSCTLPAGKVLRVGGTPRGVRA